ncbi:MAG: metallophosphoesterase [Firmicutes bacterium]|nr:metallophosphoesterase [Bacillota bacterium]
MRTKIYAISDLHLSFSTDKPMDLFGGHWTGYEEKIKKDWNRHVGPDDIGIIAGDISWAMKMSDTDADFDYLRSLNGTKIIIRGNHDYWWDSISRVRAKLGEGIHALQNDAIKIDNIVFAGTRGWKSPERTTKQSAEDKKIYDREVIRLELALSDAAKKRQEGDKLVAITHYPPFNALRDDSHFTELMEKYNVDICIYGHLHDKRGGRKELEITKGGVRYLLTSCDLLDFNVAVVEL